MKEALQVAHLPRRRQPQHHNLQQCQPIYILVQLARLVTEDALTVTLQLLLLPNLIHQLVIVGDGVRDFVELGFDGGGDAGIAGVTEIDFGVETAVGVGDVLLDGEAEEVLSAGGGGDKDAAVGLAVLTGDCIRIWILSLITYCRLLVPLRSPSGCKDWELWCEFAS